MRCAIFLSILFATTFGQISITCNGTALPDECIPTRVATINLTPPDNTTLDFAIVAGSPNVVISPIMNGISIDTSGTNVTTTPLASGTATYHVFSGANDIVVGQGTATISTKTVFIGGVNALEFLYITIDPLTVPWQFKSASTAQIWMYVDVSSFYAFSPTGSGRLNGAQQAAISISGPCVGCFAETWEIFGNGQFLILLQNVVTGTTHTFTLTSSITVQLSSY